MKIFLKCRQAKQNKTRDELYISANAVAVATLQ